MSYVLSRLEPQDGTPVIMLTRYGTMPNGVGDVYSPSIDAPDGGAVRLLGQNLAVPAGRAVTQNAIIIGTATNSLQAQLDTLAGAVGKLSKLFITMNDATQRWRRVEILSAPSTRTDGLARQEVAVTWMFYDPYWRGEHHGGANGFAWTWGDGQHWAGGQGWGDLAADTIPLTSGSPGTTHVTLPNAGNAPVFNARLRIKAGSAPITAVSIQNLAAGVSISYTPTAAVSSEIGAGATLIIDSGSRQITNGGVKDYAGFARGGPLYHRIAGWFVIPAGGAAYDIDITGGGTGAHLVTEYSESWA